MSLLPVIVGFGGINAAGRASSHHAYRRMVLESLPAAARQETVVGLTTLMNLATHNSDSTYGADSYLDTSGTHYSALELAARFSDEVLAGSLVRRIEPNFFPVDAAPWQKSMTLASGDAPVSFVTTERQLPEPIPSNWRVTPLDDGKQVRVEITGACD
ncbi:MAG TPA: beta-ketoacyl synthase, partial [Pseudomonadales bacterium]|nr:beta-ketoacyl synthase [Pseudomonadales bacterium]